jgi:PAS domain S-box-containing protein
MKKALRVLFIEDSEDDAMLLERELRKGGYDAACERVDTAETMRAALERGPWDLILSDFKMPCFSGMAALEVLRASGLDLPFIIVSGTLAEEEAVATIKAGAHDYLMKGKLARLVPAVERELDEARRRRERQRAGQLLLASEEKYRLLVEQIPDVIWQADAEERVLYISANVADMLGYTPQEIYAASQRTWIDHIHPEDAARVRAAFTALFQTGAKFDVEYRIQHKDGTWTWLHDRAMRTNEKYGIRYADGIFSDITEKKRLEGQLRQAQKMEGIGQLAGGVAHDFNNMLAVIRGNADLLLMDEECHSPQTSDCLKQIARAAERAAALTRQLLIFSRKQEMQFQPLVLNALVQNLTKMLQRVIREDIRLECRYADELPFVQADPGMMEQVLLNLVVNARDAMPGGGHLLITTEGVSFDAAYAQTNPNARAGRFVCLSVSDTGTGIAPECLGRVFEPFFTTKEPGKGTGLGLATVYGIVKQHQGWVEVSSLVGAGTTFKVFLPAIPAPANEAAAASEAELRGGSETILLVEDDYSVRVITRRVLETFKYKVYEATCAREAREVWSQHAGEIALLLTDIVMPERVTGRDLAEQLRAEKPGLKVIYMSGYSSEVAGKETDFFRRTKSCFLQKPCSTSTLIRAVRQCLDEKETEGRQG